MKLAVVGDVATQVLVRGLPGALRDLGLDGADIREFPFGQVERQLVCTDSDLARWQPDFTVVWESSEHAWLNGADAPQRLDGVRRLANGPAATGTLLYLNAAPFDDGLGSARDIRAFNAALDTLADATPRLTVIDLASVVADFGRRAAFSPQVFALGALALAPEAQRVLARRIAAAVAPAAGIVRKVVATDLDGTLWGGVLGEDGPDGLVYGDTPEGRAFAAFQRGLKRLAPRGILLAAASHNDEPLVRAAFARHPEMTVGPDDFAALVADWRPKSEQLRTIAEKLNLAPDAIVFLDDDPANRAEVRANLPGVTVPELPADPADRVRFLADLNLFPSAPTAEDALRVAGVRAERARAECRAQAVSEADYLAALGMKMRAVPADGPALARVAQLTQRTNQFNLRTRRYTEAELARLCATPGAVHFAVSLADRFGDYGLVAALVAVPRADGALFIDTWVTSCRALGRGLERFAFEHLVREAQARGCRTLVGEYLPTDRNALVADLYPALGFVRTGDMFVYGLPARQSKTASTGNP